jgi:hypothetical protein
MSRTRHREKAKKKVSQHCTVTGCMICENQRLAKEANRKHKQVKQELKAKEQQDE